MALLFWEGFDSFSDITQLQATRTNVNGGFGSLFNQWPNILGGGRYNLNCIGTGIYQSFGLIDTSSISTPTEMFTGRAVLPTGDTAILGFYGSVASSSYPDIYVDVVSNGIVRVIHNTNGAGAYTVLGQTTQAVAPYNVWHFFEARCILSSTTSTADGTVEVWVNNQKVLSLTGVITKQSSGSTYWLGTTFGTPQGTRVDDIYILDTAGPGPWNTRLGDCRIASVAVTSDAGPNDGTVSTGSASHYTVVDEIPYSASDYLTLGSLSSGFGEIFGHANLPSPVSNNIFATAVVAVGGKTDAGNAAFKIALRTGPQGSNTYNSNTQFLSTTNTFYRQEWVTNPNTSSQWTLGEWANANVGIYVV